MSQETKIRKKAIVAMKAVTASAIFFAGVSCSSEEESTDVGFSVNEPDVATSDTGEDTAVADIGADTAVADADDGAICNTEVSTGVCPDQCDRDNDIDCCESDGGDWWDGQCGPVAVPGPFVPPSMRA